jgi:hypothetical protein
MGGIGRISAGKMKLAVMDNGRQILRVDKIARAAANDLIGSVRIGANVTDFEA